MDKRRVFCCLCEREGEREREGGREREREREGDGERKRYMCESRREGEANKEVEGRIYMDNMCIAH